MCEGDPLGPRVKILNFNRGEAMPTFTDAGRVIERNLEALRKPGILAVRPGYRTEAGWPVGDPVIVALVGAKKGEAAAYGLPSQVGGIPSRCAKLRR